MTTRSGRRVAAEPQHLSHIEALLLAQGTWEMGADSTTWSPIAKILSKHPLVSRPKSFFTPQVIPNTLWQLAPCAHPKML